MTDVACAIIKNTKGEILVTQRSTSMRLPLKWEFPGGKVEENETAEECLFREIKEELDIEITVLKRLTSINYHYDDFSIHLIPFICMMSSGTIKLSEHSNYLWLETKNLKNLDWAEADVPILEDYIMNES